MTPRSFELEGSLGDYEGTARILNETWFDSEIIHLRICIWTFAVPNADIFRGQFVLIVCPLHLGLGVLITYSEASSRADFPLKWLHCEMTPLISRWKVRQQWGSGLSCEPLTHTLMWIYSSLAPALNADQATWALILWRHDTRIKHKGGTAAGFKKKALKENLKAHVVVPWNSNYRGEQLRTSTAFVTLAIGKPSTFSST